MIELLTVIIIIAVLAMIAISVFLGQRRKAWDANVESDLHNAAVAQLTYYEGAGSYTSQLSELLDAGYKESSAVTLTIVSAGSESYCMEAYHSGNPSRVWYVVSGEGNPNPELGNCP